MQNVRRFFSNKHVNQCTYVTNFHHIKDNIFIFEAKLFTTQVCHPNIIPDLLELCLPLPFWCENLKKSTIHPPTNLTQSPPSIKFDDCNCLDAIHISNLFCRELCEPEVLCELVSLTLQNHANLSIGLSPSFAIISAIESRVSSYPSNRSSPAVDFDVCSLTAFIFKLSYFDAIVAMKCKN